MSDKNVLLLNAENINVGYRKKVVVSDISFSVKPGEILTIIGPNGSGKSTILKSIASQLELICGTVMLNGKDISIQNERDIAKQLSVMLTNKINTELMTCREIVESGRYPYTNMLGILTEKDRKAVEDSMKLTETTSLAECDFMKISDGQRQRVLLAKAVCQEPDILVLDEPTSFLDIKHKLELLSLLKKLAIEKNTGIVMTLHELDLAMKISDSVLAVKDNKADCYGKADEIFTSEYINKLYDIENGSFNSYFGTTEFNSVPKKPEVFVIGGGGTAVNVYRKLQRLNIPFSAGILHENDIEYPAAKALAVNVITETAFEPISEAKINEALEIMSECKSVICTLNGFGTMNKGNETLKNQAEADCKISEFI